MPDNQRSFSKHPVLLPLSHKNFESVFYTVSNPLPRKDGFTYKVSEGKKEKGIYSIVFDYKKRDSLTYDAAMYEIVLEEQEAV